MAEEGITEEDYDSDSGEELPKSDSDVVEVNLMVESSGDGSDWYIDSDANTHVTGSKALLHDFIPCDGHATIMTASGTRLPILGRGNVITKKNKEIANILYVPGLKHNLISVSKLTNIGNIVIFTSDECLMIDKDNSTLLFCVLLGIILTTCTI